MIISWESAISINDKSALAYATSIAGTFITTDCVITDEAMNVTVSAIDPLLDEDRGMLSDVDR